MENHGEENISVAAGEERSYRGMQLNDYREETRSRRGSMDLPYLLITVILLVVGVIMVLSSSFARAYYDIEHVTGGNATYYFVRQTLFAVSGIMIMLLVSRFKVKTFRRFSVLIMVIALVFLCAVPVVGTRVNGAKRWISLGFTTFQPSEIAKIALILLFSAMICRFGDKMKTFKYGVLPFGIVMAVIVGLLLLEPHLSASIIILVLGAAMMFAGGTKLRYFGIALAVVLLLGIVVVKNMDYAAARIATWKDPFSDLRGDGWQTVQSLYSVGSGGLLGVGLGQSRQKYLYLPEEHNDFIFSVICEELGFVGAILILALFAMLIIRGYWIALNAKNKYGSLVATGITTLLALQVFLNVAVVTNLVPCTGISLPFFSYGGTALWLQLAETGIMLSISREIPVKKAG